MLKNWIYTMTDELKKIEAKLKKEKQQAKNKLTRKRYVAKKGGNRLI